MCWLYLALLVVGLHYGAAVNYNETELSFEEITRVTSLVNMVKHATEYDTLGEKCIEDLESILDNIDREWALRMIDSGGKIPHGILRLNKRHMGQHRECVATVSNRTGHSGREFTGQHCMLTITINRKLIPVPERANLHDLNDVMWHEPDVIDGHITPRFDGSNDERFRDFTFELGMCLPSTCNVVELIALLNKRIGVPGYYQLGVLRGSCTVEKSIKLSAGDIVVIVILSVVGGLMLVSTVYDAWFQIIKEGDKKQQPQLLIAFSMYTNSQRLFTPSKNPGPLACLHGIRVFSFMWVVLGHRYFRLPNTPLENMEDVYDWGKRSYSSIITGSTVSVDTFLVMSGVLLAYTFFRSAKMSTFYWDLFMFYVHRILRLLPPLAAVVMLQATLISHYGNGPYKGLILDRLVVQPCKDFWWSTVLFIQNHVPNDGNMCMRQTWYLGVDMQLYVISPLLLYPLLWNKKIGLLWTSFCVAVAQATIFALVYNNTYNNHKPPHKIYAGAYGRATPYFCGLLTGYLLYHSFKNRNIKTTQYNFMKLNAVKKMLVMVGWVCCLVVMAAVLFGNLPIFMERFDYIDRPTKLEYLFFETFKRSSWGVAIIGIIILCAYGYGGPINWFLSLPAWEVMGRLSYCVYLTHVPIQMMFISNTNHVRLFNHQVMIVDFLGDLTLAFGAAYILVMSFESPVGIIEKVIFKRDKPKQQEVTALPATVPATEKSAGDQIIPMETKAE